MRFDITALTLVAFIVPALAAKTWDVNIVNGKFNPATLDISPGDTVVWPLNDGAVHAIVEIAPTATASCMSKAGGFNSGSKAKAQAYQRTFPVQTVVRYKDGIGANCKYSNDTGIIYVGARPNGSLAVGTTVSAGTTVYISTGGNQATQTIATIVTATIKPNAASGMLVQSSLFLGVIGVVGALAAF